MAHTPGSFCWTDLAAPDMGAAERFYGELFRWTSEAAGDPEETRGYTFFLYDGKRVAGYGPPGPGEPPSWRPYVAVESADETTAKVRDAGGQVVMEPMDVMGEGRMGVFVDPTGAVICVWQPRAHEGAQLSGEPYSMGWLELATRDIEAAKGFYSAAFGWTGQDMPGGTYTLWLSGETEVGGMMGMETHPPEVPPHWLVYFVVDDVDGSAGRAGGLGGQVVVEPMTIEVPDRDDLRLAVLADPNGAAFGILRGDG